MLVASIGAHKVLPGLTAYAASKAATAHMGKSLAREWARKGINVNVLCPGYIKTELNDDWFRQRRRREAGGSFPRKRLMETSDLEAMALLPATATWPRRPGWSSPAGQSRNRPVGTHAPALAGPSPKLKPPRTVV